MRKALKRIGICLMVAVFVWLGALIADRQTLRNELVRLHVVAASDSEADQAVKLQVRDAVLESLRAGMEDLTDAERAEYLNIILFFHNCVVEADLGQGIIFVKQVLIIGKINQFMGAFQNVF